MNVAQLLAPAIASDTQVRVADRTEPDARSIYISSILAVTALFFFGVGLPCWYAFNLAWGVGLGGMCAVWGGPGFGVMAAGARLSAIEERAHRG